MNYCKLTNQNLRTHNDCQWVIGEWKETNGKGELCTEGWLHAYTHPLLAVFLNEVHANINNPKLFEIEVGGETKTDHGLKVGFTKMRLTKEIPLPKVTDTQRLAFAILCAKEVETNEKWNIWADNWLQNINKMDEFSVSQDVIARHYTASAGNVLDAIYYYKRKSSIFLALAVEAAALESHMENKDINLIALAQKALTFN